MATSLPTRLHSSDVAFDSVAAVESWTNGSSSSPGPELFVTADTFAVLSGLAARPPRRAAQISARPAVRGWIGAQLVLLLLTCSPRGVALATALVRVAGVALRHVAALVAAALGPRRSSLPPSSPRRPHTYSRRPRRPTALVAAALDASTPPPSTPPPSHPRRRRPRRRRPRRRRPHCSPAYTTLWLCVHCCDNYCERCCVCARVRHARPVLGHPCCCMHVSERVVERRTVRNALLRPLIVDFGAIS